MALNAALPAPDDIVQLFDHRKDSATTIGVILAGGRGARMSAADKPLLMLADKPIIEYVIENAWLQVDSLLISANRNLEQYARYGLPVVEDSIEGFRGPLAGILSAMEWCSAESPESRFIACFPGDVPWFPDDVVELLAGDMASDTEITWLSTAGQLQPLFSLWSVDLRPAVREALAAGLYSPMQFIRSRNNRLLTLDNNPPGYFDNLNSPADLERARAMLNSFRAD